MGIPGTMRQPARPGIMYSRSAFGIRSDFVTYPSRLSSAIGLVITNTFLIVNQLLRSCAGDILFLLFRTLFTISALGTWKHHVWRTAAKAARSLCP